METRALESIAGLKSGHALLAAIKDVHSRYPLSRGPNICLSDLNDELLSYLLSLTRGETPVLPNLSDTEWKKMVQSLEPHRISPLIYSKIMSLQPAQQPPEEIVSQLKQEYYRSKISTVLSEEQLKEIVDQFKKDEIRLIVLKGSALARSIYSDPALRQGCDIDILVHPQEVQKARKSLESIGYICKEKCYEISKKLYNEEVFINPSRKHYKMVEVHWNLYTSCDVDIGQFFDRSVPIEARDCSFEILNPVDALLYNGLHMVMHHDSDVRLTWIFDADLLARSLQSPEDWQRLQNNSVLYGATRSIQVSLEMAKLWTGLELPPTYEDLSRWPQPGKAEQAALDHMYLSRSELMLDNIRFTWYCSTKLHEKVLLIIYLIFPPAEMIRNEFPGAPGWMLPVNYIRRWLKITSKLIIYKGSARVDSNQ